MRFFAFYPIETLSKSENHSKKSKNNKKTPSIFREIRKSKYICHTLLKTKSLYIRRMNETKDLLDRIKEGIQEKKGKNIVIADLTDIEDTICNYFIICNGNSPSQVMAITESIKDYVRETAGVKPLAIDGTKNAQWVAMDYNDIIAHIFLPEQRDFYNLEHLWADAKLTRIPDLD